MNLVKLPKSAVLPAWFLMVLAVAWACLGQTSLSTTELGQRLYETGVGIDGQPVVAVIESPSPSTPGVELPATALPCAGCHGRDGRGRSEGGADPTDLRPHSLTRTRQAVTPSGRQHPPYDDPLVIRAVTLGFDPAGSRLETAMPRYRLSHGDAEALLAYLKTLGQQPHPGVHDDRIEIGVIRPATPDAAQQAGLQMLRVWRDRISAAGGIYGREIVLREVSREEVPSEVVSNPAAWIVLSNLTADLSSGEPSQTPVLRLGKPSAACSQFGHPPCFTISPPSRPVASRRWQNLAANYGMPREHLGAQLQALAATEILTAALEQAGRRLDSESLQLALRDPNGFRTSIGRIRLASSYPPTGTTP